MDRSLDHKTLNRRFLVDQLTLFESGGQKRAIWNYQLLLLLNNFHELIMNHFTKLQWQT